MERVFLLKLVPRIVVLLVVLLVHNLDTYDLVFDCVDIRRSALIVERRVRNQTHDHEVANGRQNPVLEKHKGEIRRDVRAFVHHLIATDPMSQRLSLEEQCACEENQQHRRDEHGRDKKVHQRRLLYEENTHTHTHTHIHTEVHIRRYEQHIQTHAQGAMTRGKEDVSVFRINISIKKVQSIFRLSMCAVYNGEVHDSFFFFSRFTLSISRTCLQR